MLFRSVENFVFRNAGNDRFGGRVTFSGNPESISTFARGLFSPSIPMISGEVSLRIDLSQPSGNLRMQCHLASPRLRIADIPAANPLNAENVSAVVHWSGDAVTLDSMHVETLGGTLKGSGTLALREGEMRDFNVRFQRLDSGQIARFLGIHAKEYSGSFSGWCSASGKIESIETMNAALVVEVNKAFFHSKPIPDLAAHSVLDKGVLNARISGAHSMITITADVMKSALAGKFTADINQLSDFSPIPGMDDLRGKIHVSGILGGTPSRPEVSASVAGDSIRYRNFPLDSLKGGVEYRNNAVSFSNVRLAGRISSLATLKPPLHVDSLSGTVSYAIEMDGPLTGPAER